MERPDCVTGAMLEYLDDLRANGRANILDAIPYLEDYFNLTRADAYQVLRYWMQTYSTRHPQ